MSTPKQVYEGSDPNSMLKEILEKHGSSVVISKPELVRKGGVLGFFATSQYRVEVRPKSPRTEPERISVGAHTGTRGALESLVEKTRDTLDLHVPTHKSFEAVLDDVADSLGDDPSRFTESPLMTEAREYLSRSTGNVATSSAENVAAPLDEPDRLRPSVTETGIGSGHDKNDDIGSAVELSTRVFAPSTQPLDLDRHRSEPFVQKGSIPKLSDLGVIEQPSVERHDGCNAVIDQLRQVMFPSALINLLIASELQNLTLETAFSLIAPLPKLPKLSGSLIAVVGSPDLAHQRGTAIAKSLGIASTDIAVARQGQPATKGANPASPGHNQTVLVDAKQAAIMVSGLRRDRLVVVVIEHGDSKSSDLWTRAILRALRPTATWATIDARTKRIDIERFAESIGGIDALLIENVHRTSSPCEVLESKIPIARLGGKLATPAAWAKVVAAASRHSTDPAKR